MLLYSSHYLLWVDTHSIITNSTRVKSPECTSVDYKFIFAKWTFFHEENRRELGRTTGLLKAFGCKHNFSNEQCSHRQRHGALTPVRVDHTFERWTLSGNINGNLWETWHFRKKNICQSKGCRNIIWNKHTERYKFLFCLLFVFLW